jgi:uroporphyrinogen-III synthase
VVGPLIYLLRTPEEPVDPYEAALRAAGFSPRSIPVLAFNPVGDEALQAALADPGRYAGVILTSPRAAERLVSTLEYPDLPVVDWQQKPVFAVGPATGYILDAAGFTPRGFDRGSGASLAEAVRLHAAHGRWLFVCGDRRLEVLPEALHQAGVPFDECVVYETLVRPPAWEDLDAPWAAVFFSPSGVTVFAGGWPGHWEDVRTVAFGKTTAAALREAGRTARAVANAPTPAALVAAIAKAGADRGDR